MYVCNVHMYRYFDKSTTNSAVLMLSVSPNPSTFTAPTPKPEVEKTPAKLLKQPYEPLGFRV